MAILSRRTLLAGAAGVATTAGWWGSQSARAAVPQDTKQAASFYRYKVGSIEITVVSDGIQKLPVTPEFVPNATVAEVNAALADNFMEPGTFVYPYNPCVINNGSRLAIIDMGTGEAANLASKGLNGQVLANLAAAGIDAKAIDTVIISHYHGCCGPTGLSPTRTRKSWCRRRNTNTGWTMAREAARRPSASRKTSRMSAAS
jgi:hypothetical protein